MDPRFPSLIQTAEHPDHRGSHHKFFGASPEPIAVPDFTVAEVFMTHSHRDVVRGINLQSPPQPKLITAITGAVMGNAVCCDPSLDEFGTVFSFQLAAGDGLKLYVPPLWAQGYRVLMDDTRMLYMAGVDFSPEGVGINPFDPALDFDWGSGFLPESAVMADRDRNHRSFSEVVEQLKKVAAAYVAQERTQA